LDWQSFGDEMKTPEQRERARLRSERWRRAHGIGPRPPASKPWIAEGVSRYRRRAKARQQAALADLFDRADAFQRRLRAELTAAAGFMTVAHSILHEFPVYQ
jgi:hypothetical protein